MFNHVSPVEKAIHRAQVSKVLREESRTATGASLDEGMLQDVEGIKGSGGFKHI